MMSQDDKDKSSKINLNFWKQWSFVEILAYPLAVADLGTTSYGIFTQALELKGFLAIVISFVLAVIFLWVALISKAQVAPAIEKKFANPIRDWSFKVEQSKWVEIIADALAPVTVVSIGIIFCIVDFWTSLEGVSAIIPFKGILGGVLKIFAVFALVFSTVYLIYLQPKRVDDEI